MKNYIIGLIISIILSLVFLKIEVDNKRDKKIPIWAIKTGFWVFVISAFGEIINIIAYFIRSR
jgi:hypothetical protein